MFALMNYRDKMINTFTEVMTGLLGDLKEREIFPSDHFLLTLAQIFDMTVSIDAMKNFKGSMNNDLSMYKRAISFFVKEQSQQEQIQLPSLAFFIATQDQFASDMRKAFGAINNTIEEVVVDLIQLCLEAVEKNEFYSPNTKHSYLRAIAFSLTLLDNDGDDRDVSRRKGIKLEKIGKLFSQYPIVPLYGDLSVSLYAVISKMPHLGNLKWELNTVNEDALSRSYDLVTDIEDVRNLYRATMTSLAKLTKVPQLMFNVVSAGCKVLAGLTMRCKEHMTYKFMNPNKSPDAGYADASIYELAIQHNYTEEEKVALLEYIVMIKNLAGCLLDIKGLQTLLDTWVYTRVQNFATCLIEHLPSAQKKKKTSASIIKYVTEMLLDNPQGPVKTHRDPVTPSQLYFSRAIISLSIDERTKAMKGGWGLKEKHFNQAQVTEFTEFLRESSDFTTILEIEKTIKKCNDVSHLWFREFYLELSKRVQFPISTSLPWILSDFILNSTSSLIYQHIFIPFDIYNDVAYNSLYNMQTRTIYEEVEAEVNLFFDQFMFKLGKKIFVHYKKAASIMQLPTDFKKKVYEGMKPILQKDGLELDAYACILRQRNISLLGRSIDISKILAASINIHIRTALNSAIDRFEASELSSIMELEALINNSRLCHQLLSEYLDLDNFEDLLQEVDENIRVSESTGRIVERAVTHSLETINGLNPEDETTSYGHSLLEEYKFLLSQHKKIMNFKDLKNEIFQGFRELGNCLVLMQLFDSHVRFSWTKSRHLIQDIIALEDNQNNYLESLAPIISKIEAEIPSIDYQNWTKDVIHLTKIIEHGPKIFRNLMLDLRDSCLKIEDWQQTANCQFFKIWNSLLFVLCVPSVAGTRNIRVLFGDGIFLAGTTLTHVLDQPFKLEVVNNLKALLSRNQREATQDSELMTFLNTAEIVVQCTEEWSLSIENY